MKIKGFIFDLDGTLTFSQKFHFLAYAEIFKRYGINYTIKEDLEEYSGQGSKNIFPKVFAKHKKKFTAADLKYCINEKKKLYSKLIAKSKIETVPGIKKFLYEARKNKLKIIIATGNKLAATKKILQKTGLNKYIKKIISTSEVKNPKPAPDIFLLAAKKLGILPEECIVFEDSLNGITAAKEGNMYCIGLTTGISKKKIKKAGANLIIDNYQNVKIASIIDQYENIQT